MFNDLSLIGNMPSFAPFFNDNTIQKLFNTIEQSYKQPIKQQFSYPIDIKKVYDKETRKFKKLTFEIALAGIKKEAMKVQLIKGKYLFVKVSPNETAEAKEAKIETATAEEPEVVVATEGNETVEYVSKSISHRDCEITFKMFFDVDSDRFSPVYENGILRIDIYPNESSNDFIDAVIS